MISLLDRENSVTLANMGALALRKFPAAAASVADDWYRDPICTASVTPLGAFSQSADGACQVALPDGSLAYVKPRPDAEKKLVVAREKIAADLGHLLDLPVAPVAVRLPDQENGWPFHSAISLVCLPAGRLWQDGGSDHLLAAAEGLETLRIFWTWIGDQDHGGHGANLLYEVRDGACNLAAIDHSYSLCHGNPANALSVGACPGYGTATLAGLDRPRQAAIAAIQSISNAEIEALVRRLGMILTDSEQDLLLRILHERRVNLAALLGL